jgi:hypothetical protein
MPDKNQLY